MPSLKVHVALYDYEANTEEELSIKKNDVLYILEDDDPHWWKAKLKTADPNYLYVGLVPSNYVEPVSNPCSAFDCPISSLALGLWRWICAYFFIHHNQVPVVTRDASTFQLQS